MKTTLLTVLLALGMAASANATVIAVIDSGTDLEHKDLTNKKWVNLKDVDDGVDNDDNGYIDDVNGWNFADNNNKLIDKKFLGTFSPDTYKFFEVQTRLLKGEGTEADHAWINEARHNQKLIAELGVFGNFVHGTHVAGLVAKNADLAKVMVLKIIPTKAPTVGPQHNEVDTMYAPYFAAGNPDALIRMGLKLLAAQQAKSLSPIGKYVADQKARIANCSFGTSTPAIGEMVIRPLLQKILKRDPTDEEVRTYASFFVTEAMKAAKSSLLTSKGTLFVIAAGNDGTNNDELPTTPANIKQENTIAVSATLGYKKLASFSNYGEKMVEVAAPGVGIESSIPGDLYLTVSGTSQASPFVANIAGRAVDENPSLSNSDLKMILMATVDLKDYLKGKVTSGGIVNVSRALMAAKLSKSMQLFEAISTSRLQVNDIDPTQSKFQSDEEGYVIPLPSLFY